MASDADPAAPAEDTVLLEAEDLTRAAEDWPVADHYLVESHVAASPAHPGGGETTVVLQRAESPPPAVAARRFPPGLGTGLMLALAGVAGAIALAILLLGGRNDDATTAETAGAAVTTPKPTPGPTPAADGGEIVLRDVTGMPLRKARSLLEEEGLRVRASKLESGRPRSEVLTQQPSPGTKVRDGEVVALVSSSGPAPSAPQSIAVPAVVGLAASEAVTTIREAGLEARVRFVSSSQPAGTVLGQSPEGGTDSAAGSTVVLEVAKGRPSVQALDVPDVVGMSAAAARRVLRAAGFSVAIADVPSDEPAGTVIAQSPPAGADLRKGSSVELRVSSGPADVDVPDVTGMDLHAATFQLENAGFEVRVIDEPTADPAQDGLVIRQTPAGASSATRGAVVTLTVARLV